MAWNTKPNTLTVTVATTVILHVMDEFSKQAWSVIAA